MYLRLFGWEFFAESVAKTQKFLDWDFSECENHVWIAKVHIVFNPLSEASKNGSKGTGATYSMHGDPPGS